MRHFMNVLLIIVAASTPMWATGEDSLPGKPLLEPGMVHTQPTELPKPEGLSVSLEAYPRTNGSTSAEPLGVWVACRLLRGECWWTESTWGDERRLLPAKADGDTTLPASERFDDAAVYSRIRHQGTHGAYKRLIEGETDLIYECRRPSEDEIKLMKEKQVELDIRPVALDAFVFLRHKDNPVTGLTLDQVRDIYTPGADNKAGISNWSEVDGPDLGIHAYLRNRNSGSQETMESLVMKERSIIEGPSMTGHTMMGPYNRLHNDTAGIGFTFFYYQHYMSPMPGQMRKKGQPEVDVKTQTQPVEMLAIDEVMPSRETIANRSYPLVTEVYVVTRKDLEPGHPAAKLRDWLLTTEGQRIIGETGYVPVMTAKGENSNQPEATDGE